MSKAKDKVEMQSILDIHLCGMEESERALAKQRRILAVKLDDLKKQQDLSETQVSSMVFERANIKTERQKLKRSHSQALQFEQETRERDKKVPQCSAASFGSFVRGVSFILPHDSLIVLLF